MSYSQKKLKYWRGILSQYRLSGMKPVEFCRVNRLAVKSFYKWRIRLSAERPEEAMGESSELTLVELQSKRACTTPPPGRSSGSGVSLEIGSLKINLETHFDGDTLRRVLDAAGVRPC